MTMAEGTMLIADVDLFDDAATDEQNVIDWERLENVVTSHSPCTSERGDNETSV